MIFLLANCSSARGVIPVLEPGCAGWGERERVGWLREGVGRGAPDTRGREFVFVSVGSPGGIVGYWRLMNLIGWWEFFCWCCGLQPRRALLLYFAKFGFDTHSAA